MDALKNINITQYLFFFPDEFNTDQRFKLVIPFTVVFYMTYSIYSFYSYAIKLNEKKNPMYLEKQSQ